MTDLDRLILAAAHAAEVIACSDHLDLRTGVRRAGADLMAALVPFDAQVVALRRGPEAKPALNPSAAWPFPRRES